MLPGYWQQTFGLGPDPDGEGDLVATLVRRGEPDPSAAHAVLLVHGFTDYFFHTELADHFAARGFAFYALDLHKCGRSWREGQTPHFTTDLARYDTELERALDIIAAGTGGAKVLVYGHSAGGLIVVAVAGPVAASRRHRSASASPAWCSTARGWTCRARRSCGPPRRAAAIGAVSRFRKKLVVRSPTEGGYGATLHRDYARRIRLRPELEADRRISRHVRLDQRDPARTRHGCTAGSTSGCRT